MIAAEHNPVLFQSMPNDFHLAVGAGRRQRADGAFKAIESVGFIQGDHLERLVILVSARVAFWHKSSSIFGVSGANRPHYRLSAGESGRQQITKRLKDISQLWRQGVHLGRVMKQPGLILENSDQAVPYFLELLATLQIGPSLT
jgi:hypothetical protein